MDNRMAERAETLSPQEKRALLARLYSIKVRKPQTAPMSFAQERIWLLDRLEPGNPAFNITTAYCLSGPLDTAVLEWSLNKIIQRHAVLRTVFTDIEGQPVQVIAPDLTLKLLVQDLQSIPDAERDAQVRQWVTREQQRPFDLARGPLLRANLLRLDTQEHVLILTTHRIVFDGQCWRVLISEVIAFCEDFSNDKPPSLPKLHLQYADFAAWQREWMTKKVQERQLNYWQEKLGGKIRLLRLPTDHPRSAVQSRSETQSFVFSENLSQAVRSLSQREGVSQFVTLLAAFETLLYRYAAQENFLVFSSIAGRSRPELQGLLGLFANILALRADLSNDPSFRDLLKQVQETVADAYAHQDLPFEYILETLQVERERYTPVFQVMFIFWPEPLPPLEWPSMTFSPLEVHKPAEFDLHLHITNTHPAMSGALRYKADLFKAATITRLLEHLQALLAAIVKTPKLRISELPNLTDAGKKAQVWAEQGVVTGSVPILPSQWSFLQTPHLWVNMVEVIELYQHLDAVLLEQAVQHIFEHHDALRTRFVYESSSWQQLILAPGDNVPFTCLDLSELPAAEHELALKSALDMLQGSLGPLQDKLMHVVYFDLGKHRPGYLVFNVHHVASDNASLPILLEDLHTTYQQLSQSEPVQLPPKTTSVKAWAEQVDAYLRSATFRQQLNQELALLPAQRVSLPVDFPAGRDQNTVASIASVKVVLGLEETNILLREFPRVYKVWLIDILLTSLVQVVTRWTGGRWMTLQIVDSGRNMELSGTDDVDLSRTVGCLFVPGTLALEKPDTDDPVEALRLVGEQLRRFPTYGISAGIAQQTQYRQEGGQRLPPVELRLNYLGQTSLPDLQGWSPHTSTAVEDFVDNRRNGNIDRNPTLLNCTAVVTDGSLVVDWEYSESVHRRATIEQVADDLSQTLRAMVRDYQRVREEGGATASALEQVFVAPRTPVEQTLADIWAQALGAERVGVHHNFFELGGDSLLATRIMSRVRGDFQIDLPFHTLIESPTITGLAKHIDAIRKIAQGLQASRVVEGDREEGVL